jgi:DNA repair protein RecO (recombination protein O)
VPTVVTTAIVLHALNYSESSRILRLATREAGVQSVMARGARASQRRFGSAVDLFAEGEVQYEARVGRDMHTLARFDVQRSRTALGTSLDRFEGASALSELMLRVSGGDDTPEVAFDALRDGLDEIASEALPSLAAIRSNWRLLAALGFSPALDACLECDTELPPDADACFSAESGGVLCDACGARRSTRRLPAAARTQLRLWLDTGDGTPQQALDQGTERAHRRLLRVFVHSHLTDGRPLKAFDAWAAA